MSEIIKALIWLLITFLEVNLLIISYIMGLLYLLYDGIKNKKRFKETFSKSNDKFINDIVNVLKSYKKLLVKA